MLITIAQAKVSWSARVSERDRTVPMNNTLYPYVSASDIEQGILDREANFAYRYLTEATGSPISKKLGSSFSVF